MSLVITVVIVVLVVILILAALGVIPTPNGLAGGPLWGLAVILILLLIAARVFGYL